MLGKLKAALDARQDADLQVVARTDAISVDGIDAALDRAHAFIEAGADVVFVEAPTSLADIERIAALPVPQVMNIVIGGKTPMMSLEELRELGFGIVLYANAPLQATILAVQELLRHLKDTGSLQG
jgi:2-methylisocitrate lyase-like PEP mutase family enzyme